ncbi:MAG: histidine phosphatase family protein, partial [Actinobacteria bacterium]
MQSTRHTLLLMRHGEVENPRHVVYSDLPGFHLSAGGRAQAAAA